MSDAEGRLGSFLAELRRRKVYQVAGVYLVLAVAGLELLSVLIPATRLPEWSDALFLALAVLGFPVVIAFAWVYDITEQGIERSPSRAAVEHAPGGEVDEGLARVEGSEADDPAEGEARDPRTVAVLPFENLSGTLDAGPFAAGLHDDLLTELSRVSALTVISRTSVMRYRDSGKTVGEISHELGAGTVVEGGVQRVGDRVRLNVQLIDARTDAHGWAERFDRELTAANIFDIQTELAQRIAATVSAELTAEEQARIPHQPTSDLEAYRLYALGREVFVGRTEARMRQATEYFEAALERDPDYALAWAGLGLAITQLVDYGHSDPAVELPKAEAACAKALALDPTLAEAYAVVGCVHIAAARREGPQAVRALERAVELQPSYAGAYQWLCWSHLLLGDPRRALEAGRHAVRLDPLDPEARGNLSVAHLGCGDPESALAEARRTLERHPDYDYGRWAEAVSLWALGRPDEATPSFRRLTEGWVRDWTLSAGALERARAGDGGAASEIAARLEAASSHFHAGIVSAALGEVEAGITALQRAAPLAWDQTLYVRYASGSPIDALRTSPRFEKLLADLDASWGLSS